MFWALLCKTHLWAISQKRIMTKSRGNANNWFFRHISGIFGRKKIFSKIGLSHIFGIANTRLCAKNQEKQIMKSRENAKKPVFPEYFRHFRPEKSFWIIVLPHILGIAILLCKISWKNIKCSSRNSRNTVFQAKSSDGFFIVIDNNAHHQAWFNCR